MAVSAKRSRAELTAAHEDNLLQDFLAAGCSNLLIVWGPAWAEVKVTGAVKMSKSLTV